MQKAAPLVLLVDDDNDTREMYALDLRMARLRTSGARDADEAWRQIQTTPPDIVVTDVLLTRSNGLELCWRIKQDERTARIPVIALTGRTLDHDTMVAVSAGCESVLTKPCAPDALRAEIHRILQKARETRAKANGPRARVDARLDRANKALNQRKGIASRRQGGRSLADMSTEPVPCPHCGDALMWKEMQSLNGYRFDYFSPCRNGCGEYFFDHGMRKFQKFRR